MLHHSYKHISFSSFLIIDNCSYCPFRPQNHNELLTFLTFRDHLDIFVGQSSPSFVICQFIFVYIFPGVVDTSPPPSSLPRYNHALWNWQRKSGLILNKEVADNIFRTDLNHRYYLTFLTLQFRGINVLLVCGSDSSAVDRQCVHP